MTWSFPFSLIITPLTLCLSPLTMVYIYTYEFPSLLSLSDSVWRERVRDRRGLQLGFNVGVYGPSLGL